MKRLALFISGTGGNALNLLRACREGRVQALPVLGLASTPKAGGIPRLAAEGLATTVVVRAAFESDEAFSDACYQAAEQAGAEVICLCGWLKKLTVPRRWEGRILNIHPGLLPQYGVDTARFGPAALPARAGARDAAVPGHHHAADGTHAETVGQPVKIDNDLYVRDYAKCILCYKCVEACGDDAQNTFAIAVAGRGFDARISTEFDVALTSSACVYCGNCIGVCPTGALMPRVEHEMRAAGTWVDAKQTQATTVCPYCGVGCELTLHVQDNEIVKVTSPIESPVTSGQLCIKGRFGFGFVRGDR